MNIENVRRLYIEIEKLIDSESNTENQFLEAVKKLRREMKSYESISDLILSARTALKLSAPKSCN